MDLDLLERRISGLKPADSPLAAAAVAVVLAPGADGGTELLLLERAVHPGDHWSGQIGLPGGRREPEDQDLERTARRETREETGIDLSDARLLGRLDDVEPRSRPGSLAVRPFVFWSGKKPAARLSEEAASFLWFPVEGLPAVSGQAAVEDRTVEAFLCGRYVVWGMTHRVLSQLLLLLKLAP